MARSTDSDGANARGDRPRFRESFTIDEVLLKFQKTLIERDELLALVKIYNAAMPCPEARAVIAKIEKKKQRKPLTEKEFKQLWRLKNAGKSNREIGLKLGITASSVHYLVGKTHDYMS